MEKLSLQDQQLIRSFIDSVFKKPVLSKTIFNDTPIDELFPFLDQVVKTIKNGTMDNAIRFDLLTDIIEMKHEGCQNIFISSYEEYVKNTGNYIVHEKYKEFMIGKELSTLMVDNNDDLLDTDYIKEHFTPEVQHNVLESVNVILKCNCGDTSEHTVHISQDNEVYDDHTEHDFTDAGMGICTISTSLNHYLPWYKKIIPSIKYILGIDNTHIFYTETVVEVQELKKAVDQLIDNSKSNKE